MVKFQIALLLLLMIIYHQEESVAIDCRRLIGERLTRWLNPIRIPSSQWLTNLEHGDEVGDLLLVRMHQTKSSRDQYFIRKYKNDPQFANWMHSKFCSQAYEYEILKEYERQLPRTKSNTPFPIQKINLDRLCLSQGTDSTCFPASQLKPSRLGLGRTQSTNRERLISHIRSGDHVLVDQKEYVLGDYLGGGNGSHNFRIARGDDAGRVLKLPFVAQDFASNYQSSRGEIADALTKYMGEVIPTAESHPIAVHHYLPSNNHLVVDYVNGLQDGRSFGEHVVHFSKLIRDSIRDKFSDSDLDKFDKFKKILKLFYTDQKKVGIIEKTTPRSFEHNMMFNDIDWRGMDNFLWDEDHLEWRLIDWDRPELFK